MTTSLLTFRAVSGTTGQMYQPEELTLTVHANGSWTAFNGLSSKNGDYLQRFTRKHDKNGNQLFEGDLIDMFVGEPEFTLDDPDRYVIEWSGTGFYLCSLSMQMRENISLDAWRSEDMTFAGTYQAEHQGTEA